MAAMRMGRKKTIGGLVRGGVQEMLLSPVVACLPIASRHCSVCCSLLPLHARTKRLLSPTYVLCF